MGSNPSCSTMKACCFCKVEKDETEFNKNSSKPDGLQTKCKLCSRAESKNYYASNPKHREDLLKRNQKYKEEIQKYIISYLKEHPCVDCGETDIVVLEFDHLHSKKENIVRLIVNCSLSKIKEEIQKCAVRCANCHKRKTAKDFGWYKIGSIV
ncbi:MAG TPA: hypothetical protein VM577_18970 [Anaerovoracaceae bacterium]|nr:hypothetical protein [Anaerovoracaceae bacterium]